MIARETGTFELARRVPAASTILVDPGQAVTAATIIATGHLDRRILRLPAGDNFELLKKPGDPVKKGETVAVLEELLGLGLRELVSPCDGIVESVNSRRTSVVVAGADSEIRALVAGRVTAVRPGEIRIAVEGQRFLGYFGLGQPVAGSLYPAGELVTAAEVKRRLGPGVAGRVVLAESYALPEVLPLLARYGAAGLVCGGLDFGPLWEMVRPEGSYPAGRGLPTVVVMEGFGVRRMSPEAREALAAAEGRSVYLAGPEAQRVVFAGPPYAEVVIA